MIGQKFGLITVLAKGPKDEKWRKSTWECVCDCGVNVVMYGRTLKESANPSCGCAQYRAVSKANKKYVTVADYLANTKRTGFCLEWQGYVTTAGYGSVGTYTPKTGSTTRRSGLVHRRVYELVHGDAPKVVMHTCDNRLCVNPKHLVGGTQKDNIADAVGKGRLNQSKRKYTATYKGKVIGLAELSTLEKIPMATLQWRARHGKELY
jgi:hypothetical protein